MLGNNVMGDKLMAHKMMGDKILRNVSGDKEEGTDEPEFSHVGDTFVSHFCIIRLSDIFA